MKDHRAVKAVRAAGHEQGAKWVKRNPDARLSEFHSACAVAFMKYSEGAGAAIRACAPHANPTATFRDGFMDAVTGG